MLSLQNLNAAYPQGFSLRDISLRIPPGQITGIIGPNGSGKTTLLKVLCHDIPFQGEIRLDRLDLSQTGLRKRARLLALVPQSIEKIPLPILDFVLMGRTPFRKWFQLDYTESDRETAWRKMEEVGLCRIFSPEEIRKKEIAALSGGERQLAAIARALCQEPEVLLLDEPTANLDLANQIRILEKIHEITRKSHCHTVLVIHDVNLAATYCQRLACLSHGRLCQEGPTEAVFTREVMEQVYETDICIGRHPISGTPLMLPRYGKEIP